MQQLYRVTDEDGSSWISKYPDGYDEPVTSEPVTFDQMTFDECLLYLADEAESGNHTSAMYMLESIAKLIKEEVPIEVATRIMRRLADANGYLP